MRYFLSSVTAAFSVTSILGFQASSPLTFSSPGATSSTPTTRPSTTFLRDTSQQVEVMMKEQYPIFHKLIMSKNSDVWKQISEAEDGFTIFAPNDDAMRNIGEKRLGQLDDIRNDESAEKIAAFHAVIEPVSAKELYNSGGVVTIGGVVDVGRSRTGGFLGIGAKEDGGTTVNGANVVKTIEIDDSLIHEMDALISPELLWRFVDQLRIPGSK
eukprot:scaffold1791_cov225-Chaetoceros_neogracile.AAC.2